MLSEQDEIVGGEIRPSDGSRVIVDEDRDGRSGGDVGEELQQIRAREQRLVVARRQHKRIVAPGIERIMAERNGLACGLRAAAHDQRHGAEAGAREGAARGAGDEDAFAGAEVDGFAVGALGREAGDAGAGEPDGVADDGGQVEVFGGGVEETEGWDVDAWVQGPVGAYVVDAGGGRGVAGGVGVD